MTLEQQRTRTIEVKAQYEKAIWAPLEVDEIQDLSILERCALIRHILDHNPQHYQPADSSVIHISLARLGASFEVSEAFYDWQDQKRKSLFKEMKKPRNRDILRAYKDWEDLDPPQQQEALIKSARLHIKTYMEGMSDVLSFKHIFEEGSNTAYGVFRSNLNTGLRTVVNYTENGRLELRAINAFDTTHHEITHLAQHHFAVGIHKKQISPKHRFYQEGFYFFAMSKHNAYIPSRYNMAYRFQPSERLADQEGGRISSGIEALAL